MSCDTYSLFYYGFEVTSNNNRIDFDEGLGEIVATLAVGSYAMSDFATELARALNDSTGVLTYTVTVNRSTRLITISSTAPFDLLVNTGSHFGTSAYSTAGFTGADLTGLSTYTGNLATGVSFSPQFPIQNYIDSNSYQQASNASVNVSASGEVEVVKFGQVSFVEMNLKYCTNRDLSGLNQTILRNNLTGLDELQSFMQFITKRQPIEFMYDESDTATFQKLRLETTEFDTKGVGYKLREQFARGLAGFFDTGILKFRVRD